ncbi:MAG: pentapeptide repeat-containing protein [Thermomicrobiales bacterium]
MDRERFDQLAKTLSSETTRRVALGTVLGAVFAGVGLSAIEDADAARRRGRRGRRRGGRRRNRRRRNNGSSTQTTTCYGTNSCTLITGQGGQSLDYCSFAGLSMSGVSCDGCSFLKVDFGGTDLSGSDLSGSSFVQANLKGANLSNADLSGTGFLQACLTDANLTGAQMDANVLNSAYLCRTTLPNGTVSNANCSAAGSCCVTS